MSIVDELIFDRTQEDVDRVRELELKILEAGDLSVLTPEEYAEFMAGMKGAYNYTDLNRVTAVMDYLDEVFEGYGYKTGYQKIVVNESAADPYTWAVTDVPAAAQMARYIANVAALRGTISVMDTTPATPESMEFLDYIKANDIEKILSDIDQLIQNMAAAWFYSGDVYSGEI